MQRRTPLRRTASLRPRSPRRARIYREQRAPLVAALLAERPTCERCGRARSVDVHELQTRARGGSILEPDNLRAVCRPCHTWITENPAAAQASGWMRPSSR